MPDQPRRDEILAWLKSHGEVARFAVLVLLSQKVAAFADEESSIWQT
jgi:hypothetical protein